MEGNYWNEEDENQVGRVPALDMVYASVKYWSRETHGVRSNDGAITLDELAAALVAVLETAWRQGHRNEVLTKAATALLRQRKRGA